MTIKCGACGENIEIPGKLIDAQHVLCPFCGEKTQYSALRASARMSVTVKEVR